MIANDAQCTASMINELCIDNSTFQPWIELFRVVTRKNIVKERKFLIFTQINAAVQN